MSGSGTVALHPAPSTAADRVVRQHRGHVHDPGADIAKFTLALTPCMRFKARSTRPAHPAQFMPVTARSSFRTLPSSPVALPDASVRRIAIYLPPPARVPAMRYGSLRAGFGFPTPPG